MLTYLESLGFPGGSDVKVRHLLYMMWNERRLWIQ